MNEKTIVVIPAQKKLQDEKASINGRKRVAAYARVSTNSDEQFTSFEAQMNYYKNYILMHDGWEFVEVYSDEGISGLSFKNRKGFIRMVEDACDGKIDLIVTKSVSRFARNTVDTLQTIRKLKQHNVEVYFEKENIYTFDGKGELLLTIMSSLAQEESRSLSLNAAWGQRRSFERGNVHLPYTRFIGYDKGPNGPIVNEDEAEIIRLIYRLFIEGYNINGIARELNLRGIQRPGEKTRWHDSSIKSIILNEKYKGSALLQKEYVADYLTKTKKKNNGEIPQYYVEKSHEAIVTPALWDFVQEEYQRRQEVGYSSVCSYLSTKLICGDCGTLFSLRSFKRKNGKAYGWVCRHKYENEVRCKTPLVKEEEIRKAFLRVYNSIISNLDNVIEKCNLNISLLPDIELMSKQLNNLIKSSEKIVDQIEGLILQNKLKKIPYEEFQIQYDKLCEQGKKIDKMIQELKIEKEKTSRRKNVLLFYADNLQKNSSYQNEFDPMLFSITVRQIMVNRDRKLRFQMYSGEEHTVSLGDGK